MSVDDPPLFTTADWAPGDRRFRPGLRTTGICLSVAVLLAAFTYDYGSVPSGTPLVAGWDPVMLDWPFLLALLVFAWGVVVPLARNRQSTLRYWSRLRADPTAVAALVGTALFVLVGAVGPALLGRPTANAMHISQPPVFVSVDTTTAINCLGTVTDGRCHGTWQYPLGTSWTGRGVLRLVVTGAHVALKVALIASLLLVPLATVVGLTAGYVGGRVETLLLRYVDVQQVLPAFVVYIILQFYLGRSLFLLVVVFGLLNWGGVARLVHGEVVQRSEEPFVLAAESAGAGHLSVIRRHVLPNVSSTVVTAATRQVPLLILTEAALSFMNLNDIDLLSWGEVIAVGLQRSPFVTWWPWAGALVALTLTVVAVSVLGDALRDVLDPRDA